MKLAAAVTVLVVLFLVASSFDYQDQINAETAWQMRNREIARACLPSEPGEVAQIAWEAPGMLVCTVRREGEAPRHAVVEGNHVRSM